MKCSSIHRALVVVGIWLFSLFILATVFVAEDLQANESSAWKALKSGNHFALLRHTIAPGTGDPKHFELRDCSTQRNLSSAGQEQAAAVGDQFRANGLDAVKVYSSQWCRCLETADLLALGPVQELPDLNSFFRAYARAASQTRAIKEWAAKKDHSVPMLLVTHQVNITALTGVYPASGEMVVVRQSKQGELTVVGRIQM